MLCDKQASTVRVPFTSFHQRDNTCPTDEVISELNLTIWTFFWVTKLVKILTKDIDYEKEIKV